MGLTHWKPYFVILMGIPCAAMTQVPSHADSSHFRILGSSPRTYQSNDTVWSFIDFCKILKPIPLTTRSASTLSDGLNLQQKTFLKVHGNIQYDFSYRSLVDTPFSQKGFAQHTIQTTLDFTIKEQYPVRVIILNRQSNSPYFNDITDVNVQFTQRQFLQQIRNDLSTQLSVIPDKARLIETERLYQQKKWEVEALQKWINHPGRIQEIVEAKENAAVSAQLQNIAPVQQSPNGYFFPKKGLIASEERIKQIRDSLQAKVDSMLTAKKEKEDSLLKMDILSQHQQKKEELNKALKDLKNYEEKIKDVKRSIQDSIALLKKQLSRITNPQQLKHFITEHKLSVKDLPKGWQALSAINNIGIGRTWVDYSELTVKNISLTGINAELNPGRFYLAFAAGKVNYRFRDFVINNKQQPNQSLYLIRAGIGQKEGNNLIFTWYDGKRNMLSSFGGIAVTARPERVIGMSMQARLQVDANNYIVLESAKSSFHTTGTVNQPKEGLMEKVLNFKDRTNEAYSIKVAGYWPQTLTKINGYYRKMGEHFQSFNLQPVNVNQVAYQLRVQQSLWKKRLTIDAGIRKNDFSNPFIYPGVASKTVFKSVQATLRVPKYPFVSIGYFPSSQLTVLDNNVIVENQYNTLSGVVSHAYRMKNLSMSSHIVFLKFYNNGADTGFIYYNASSWTISQYMFLKNLQLQTGLTISNQRDLKVKTLEQSASYQVREWLTFNGGLKHNRINGAQTLWGSSAGLGILIKKFGTVQASYEKSYLPGTARNLLPVDMGRVTYYKTF